MLPLSRPAPAEVLDPRPARPDPSPLPGGMLDDPTRRGAAAGGTVAIAVGLGLFGVTTTVPSAAVAMWVVSAIGVPLWLMALRPTRLLVVLAVALVLVPLGLRTSALVERPGPPQEAAHDGGVLVTGASAAALLDGRNPYAEDFADDLPPSWAELQVVAGESTPNPVVDHMPYLPAAFLVAVPGAVLDRAVGAGGDPRWVMGLMVLGALVALGRRPEPVWARAAAIGAFGSSFVLIYAAWGTNDAAAAALVVLAALGAARHPGWAGVALAGAVAYKAPLALALVPWAVWIVRLGGWPGLRRWWTLPATLIATTVPFLVWDPAAFIEDTVRFWTGTTDAPFPASGLGLGYRAPDLMAGPFGPVVTVGLLVLALAAAIALVRRIDHVAVLPVAGALVLLGLLVPARTFQPNYLALVAGLLAAGWLVVGDRTAPAVASGPTAEVDDPD